MSKFPDALAIEYQDLRIPFLEVNTREQWQYFIRNVDNGTYILVHDADFWQILSRHDSLKRLWVTVTLPDHFCGICEKRIKPYRKACQSCLLKQYHKNKEFFPKREPVEMSIIGSDLEMVYRQFKSISKRQRLVVTHYDCSMIEKCLHVRYYLHRYRKTLPNRTSKVSGNVTEVVQI